MIVGFPYNSETEVLCITVFRGKKIIRNEHKEIQDITLREQKEVIRGPLC